jgi:uracil-DNA glycosylase
MIYVTLVFLFSKGNPVCKGFLRMLFIDFFLIYRMHSLDTLLKEIRACTFCAEHLPLGPNPILRAHADARILLVGQAPGTRVHKTGIPWNDPSGDRLREWMDLDKDTFYDPHRIAIVPMGFCYPGKGKSGDLPPRPECARLWHEKLADQLPAIQLKLLVGQYAQKYYLAGKKKKTLTETVRAFHEYFPKVMPLPHPSPRNIGWLQRNPWFDKEVVPALRQKVAEVLRD